MSPIDDEQDDFDLDAWMAKRKQAGVPAEEPTVDLDAWMAGRGKGLPTLPTPRPGSTPSQKEMDEAFRTTATNARKGAIKYAPAIGATALSIAAPYTLPASIAARAGLLGWGLRGITSATGAGVGGALGSGAQQIFGDQPLPSFGEGAKIAAKEGMSQAGQELLGHGLGAPVEFLATKLNPYRLYQSALKPQGNLHPNELKKLLETGLREKIPVSEAGFFTAMERTDALNKQIADVIETRTKALGDVMNPESMAKRVDQAMENFNKWHQVNPEADLKTLQEVKAQFMRQHSVDAPYTALVTNKGKPVYSPEGGVIPKGEIGGSKISIPQNMTPAQAQQIKQGTYTRLRNAYGELGSANVEGQKALARGIKEDLVEMFPELKKLNARDSALIDLEQQLAKFVKREGNKQMVGLGQMMAAGIVAASADPITALPLLLLKTGIDDPFVKSRLAIALRRAAVPLKMLQKGAGKAAAGTIRLGLSQDEEGRTQPQLGTLGAPGIFARGGRMRDPLQRYPDRATTLRSLTSAGK